MKHTIKSIINSSIFKPALITTVIVIAALLFYGNLFDRFWRLRCYIPVTNINDVYAPPKIYDEMNKINIKLTGPDLIAIEGNRKLRIINHEKDFDFYDTIRILIPTGEEYSMQNKIYFNMENYDTLDSIIITISKSEKKDLYWKQIFLSSVFVSDLNKFSEDPSKFRINNNSLVDSKLLNNNDTLISLAIDYFNECDTFTLNDCNYNSQVFKKICDIYYIPCRLIVLQGGDADPGFDNELGYPQHAICEVYSSKQKKWYVIDPSLGLRFRDVNINVYLNAVEISSRIFFNKEKEIQQESILFNRTINVNRDYFQYYENVYYNRHFIENKWIKRIVCYFYNNGDNYVMQYTNNLNLKKNFYYYFINKSFGYLFLLTVHFNIIIFLLFNKNKHR